MSGLPSTAFRYVECDIPEGMTVREWHRATTPPARTRARRRRLLRRRRSHREERSWA